MSSEIARKKPRAPARVRCGICEDCLRPDCGKCRFCLGKTKFGGDGKVTKEACIHRRCKNLQVRAPRLQVEPKPEKKKRKRHSLPLQSAKKSSPATHKANRESMHCYGCPVPKPTNDVCAGCLGTRDDHLNSEPILLCDGPGCNSEYHLQCCIPEMTEVPNGNYYCLDCSRGGSSDQLDHYLDKTQEERLEFDSSLDYVNECLLMLCEMDEEIPRSELDRLSLLHADAMSMPPFLLSDIQEAPTGNEEPEELGPDFLIGKPIRLYCPDGNQYHSGRILDYRKSAFGGSFWGSSEVSNHEFLVLFPAGSEARKRSIKTWLVLEEHSCAVGVSLVWGLASPRKGILGWRPAMTYLRSSIELAAVQSQLSVADKQVYMRYGSNPLPEHPSWALAHFLGSSGTQYALLNLKEETFDLFSNRMATLLKGADGETTDKTKAYITYALSEKQEEERVRNWRAQVVKAALPRTHPRVFSAINEDSVGPVQFEEAKDTYGVNLPCPSIPMQGISRQWLLKHLGEEKKYGLGLNLACRAVGSATEMISKYREQQIQAEFERSKVASNKSTEDGQSFEANLSQSGGGKSDARNGPSRSAPKMQHDDEHEQRHDAEASPTGAVRTETTTDSTKGGKEANSTEMELDDREGESKLTIDKASITDSTKSGKEANPTEMELDDREGERILTMDKASIADSTKSGKEANPTEMELDDREGESKLTMDKGSITDSAKSGKEANSTEMELDDREGESDHRKSSIDGEEAIGRMPVNESKAPDGEDKEPQDSDDDLDHTAGINQSDDRADERVEQPGGGGNVAGREERVSPASTVTDCTTPKVEPSGDVDTPDDDGAFGSPMSDHGWSDAPETEAKDSPASSAPNP